MLNYFSGLTNYYLVFFIVGGLNVILSLLALGLTLVPDRDFFAIWPIQDTSKFFSYPGNLLPIGGIISGVGALTIAALTSGFFIMWRHRAANKQNSFSRSGGRNPNMSYWTRN